MTFGTMYSVELVAIFTLASSISRCVSVVCSISELATIAHGSWCCDIFSDSIFAAGEVVTYTCDEGYYINSGSAQRTCVLGAWLVAAFDGSNPTCAVVHCGQPESLASPHMTTYSGNPVDGIYLDQVHYECVIGEEIYTGFADATCQANGQWSSGTPTCGPVYCDYPTNGMNSKVVSLTCLKYACELEYTCDEGTVLVSGKLASVCDPAGEWSGGTAQCDVPIPIVTARQSSTVTGHEASLGNDGINTTCSKTTPEDDPWWAGDFGEYKYVRAMHLDWTDIPVGNLNLKLYVGQEEIGTYSPELLTTLATSGEIDGFKLCADSAIDDEMSLECVVPRRGRSVFVVIEGHRSISLCEALATGGEGYKHSKEFRPAVNSRLFGNVNATSDTCSLTKCTLECIRDEECVAINLHQTSPCLCELISYKSNQITPTTAVGWRSSSANAYSSC